MNIRNCKRIGIVVVSRERSTGAYNYLLNLCRALGTFAQDAVRPVLFFGEEFTAEDLEPFKETAADLVRASAFSETNRQALTARALLVGRDSGCFNAFREQKLDLVFETGQFFGWRLGLPAIAWLTDFQHRNLPHLFSRTQYWRRELGFQAQVRTGRTIMVSSEDARGDCERYYPAARGRVQVVRFAVRSPAIATADEIAAVRAEYRLREHFFYLPNQFWIHKNHLCVIEALAMLKAEGLSITVAASGNPNDPRDPAHITKLRAAMATGEVEQEFMILGMIPTPHVRVLMQSCVALINPSFSEGWSTPVEEAKAVGTALILSDLRVHLEQAAGVAQFFDPNKPRQLADILKAFAPRNERSRERAMSEAVSTSERAFREYAEAFRDVVFRASKV